MPSSVLLTIASSDDSTMAASRARSSSARLRSATSRKTRTAPTAAPPSSRIGAALSSIGRSDPSRAIRTVWLARPWIVPSRKARRAGFSTGWRVRSLTMWKTSGSGRPRASAWGQPVRASATPFMNVIRPSSSVQITASPMLASVIRSHSDCFRTASSERRARGGCSGRSAWRPSAAVPLRRLLSPSTSSHE